MPETNFDALDVERRRRALDYVEGYDWIRGRFGPPPGIPKQRKEEFDRMTDRDYLSAFLALTQEEKESLMVSEKERRRTFAAHWPIESIVKANDLAKEGFYYTGTSDRVQCAFCGGLIRNWERGDIPKFQHKNFFSYCKIVQNKPCHNMPISDGSISQELMNLSGSTLVAPNRACNLNINTIRPKHPALSVLSKRKETYRRYPESSPVEAGKLCEAGFFHEGIGDKVKCFWCDGALEMWSRGDDPWVEHAKWFPGCTFVQQTKGLPFVKEARSQLTPSDVATAESLSYNRGNVSFLDDAAVAGPPPPAVETHEGYKVCHTFGYSDQIIKEAYKANMDEEFEDPTMLMNIVQELDEGITDALEECRANSELRMKKTTAGGTNPNSTARPGRTINVNELITNPNDPTEQETTDLLTAIKCKRCHTRMAAAVLLPCGCFCVCQPCTRGSLPQKCPACNSLVRGACRTFLS